MHIKSIAVAEHIGDFPQNNLPHGNCKTITGEYVRTSCAVKQNLDDMIEARDTPREVYEDMVLSNPDCAPRDLRQVQNAKYALGRKRRIVNGHIYKKNQADEVQTLLSDIHKHPFIQEVIQTEGKPPCVVLYLEDNLKDIRQFCTSSSRIIYYEKGQVIPQYACSNIFTLGWTLYTT